MSDLTLNILLTAQDASASSVINSVGQTISNVASKLESGNIMGAAQTAVAGIGAAIAGIGTQAVQMAGQYQSSMNMVAALTGSNAQQMAQYDAGLKQLASDAGVAPNQLAQGLYNVLSAGKSGADAMNVLKLATEDAKIGMTDAATTTNALTNVLNSFNVSAQDTDRVNGEMLQTVTMGKATFEQYANNITNAASASVQYNTSLETMNAAWATLTSSGISAAHATTDYAQSLRVMDGNIGTVTASLHKNGIAFDETKFNAMSYGDKVVYLNNALQQASAEHVKVTGVTVQAAQAVQTIADHIKTYNSDLDTLSNKQQMADKTAQAWATTQDGFNQKVSELNATIQVALINIGNELLPILGKMVDWLRQVVQRFIDWENHTHTIENAAKALASALQNVGNWIGQVTDFFHKNQVAADLLKGSLVAVSIVVGVVLVAAFYSWAAAAWSAAAGVIAATWPVLAIAAAIGILVAAFLWLYNNVKPFRDFMNQVGAALVNVWNIIVTNVSPAFQQFGAFLQASFMPVWQQMVNTWQNEVIPAWNNMLTALQPIMPALQTLGEALLLVVGGALLIVTGLIGGLIGALGGMLTGIVGIIGGLVTFVTGVIQYISGIIAFFVDLFTGQWDKLGTDLATIWGGIVKMFQGVWQSIEGVFVGAINTIIGLMNGFVAGVIGPLNTILTASGQAAISVGQIPMLTLNAQGGIVAMPVYTPINQSAHKATNLPNTANIQAIGSAPKAPTAQQQQQQNTNTNLSQIYANTPLPASSLAPVIGAVNNASSNSLKAQQAAQVQQMKIADTQNKAIATSGSSQVQALVDASKTAQAQGNTALASYDAGKAQTLANQQKAAATKAAAAAAKADKAAKALAAKAAKEKGAQQKHDQMLAAKAAKQAAVLAAKAAKAAKAAADHKQLISTIQQSTNQLLSNQCPEMSSIPTALGVALPDYATGTGYVQSAPIQQQAPTQSSGGEVHHHYNITVKSDNDDPKEHGKKIADEVRKHMAKNLRGQSIAPRFTSGGTHKA